MQAFVSLSKPDREGRKRVIETTNLYQLAPPANLGEIPIIGGKCASSVAIIGRRASGKTAASSYLAWALQTAAGEDAPPLYGNIGGGGWARNRRGSDSIDAFNEILACLTEDAPRSPCEGGILVLDGVDDGWRGGSEMMGLSNAICLLRKLRVSVILTMQNPLKTWMKMALRQVDWIVAPALRRDAAQIVGGAAIRGVELVTEWWNNRERLIYKSLVDETELYGASLPPPDYSRADFPINWLWNMKELKDG